MGRAGRTIACGASVEFVEAINRKFGGTGKRGDQFKSKVKDTFEVVPGLRYDKILHVREWEGMKPTSSVHAFIERKTGYLIKAATWSSPQKNSDGTLAVRYHLSDVPTIEKIVAQADIHGSYLYAKGSR